MSKKIDEMNAEKLALEKKHFDEIQKMKDEFEIKELVNRNKITATRDDLVEQVTDVKQRYKAEIERLNKKLITERKEYLAALEKVYELQDGQSAEPAIKESEAGKEAAAEILKCKEEWEEERSAKDRVIAKMIEEA
mmetsp:Transcript_20975/g.32517  ORF Transcript_20975/g.32517 Transcript_20975/m.32517 type:complete len:136 (+) Transcript_20975:984-1391(+)